MPRNTAGIYTLPGNLFIPNTVISSTEVNSKFVDLATAMSQSLSRFGEGAMLAPLKLPDGSASAPTMTWGNDATTGFYLAATSAFRAVIAGATVQEWSNTAVTINKPLTVTSTLNVTGDTSLGGSLAVTATTTLTGVLTANGGAAFNGVGGGSGAVFKGGPSSGSGATFEGGTGNAYGSRHKGSGGLPGLLAEPSTPATASTPQSALYANAGNVVFMNTANPNRSVVFVNTLTPKNIIKAWVNFRANTGVITVNDGFNVTDVTYDVVTGWVTVTMGAAMANTFYVVSVISGVVLSYGVTTKTTTSFRIEKSASFAGSDQELMVMVVGAQ